jgi:hypothetical protein
MEQKYKIFLNGQRICQRELTLKECWNRTKRLASQGRVEALREQGYSLVPVNTRELLGLVVLPGLNKVGG